MLPSGHDEKLKQLQLDIAAAEAIYSKETGDRQHSVEIKPEVKSGLVLTNPNKTSENLEEIKARKHLKQSMNTHKVARKPI